MPINELIARRFQELEQKSKDVFIVQGEMMDYVEHRSWAEWSNNVLNLLENAFGSNSVHARNFRATYEKFTSREYEFEKAKGIFQAAKADYEGGYIFGLEKSLSGEILGDFVKLAKASLQEGHKDVAAVLASAALEDALKRYARENSLNVDDKEMQAVVGALKSKGLVSGAQKSLFDTMPKLRDYAMHANWGKFVSEDVSSIIGFVEEFLIKHF